VKDNPENTETVADASGIDAGSDAEGGAIAEATSSSFGWIWLIVILAIAAAGVIFVVAKKSKKEEK
jgi:hypothetical protein